MTMIVKARQSPVSLRRWLPTMLVLLLTMLSVSMVSRVLYSSSLTTLKHNLAAANAKLAATNAKLSAIEMSSKPKTLKKLRAEQLRLDRLATHRICVVVRTHPRHANVLPITLLSLTQQSYDETDISISLFVVNTDSEGYKETAFMDEAAADANLKAGRAAVSVLDSAVDGLPLPPNASTLDVTNRVMEDLLATSSTSKCTHFLFTNGDYFYSSSLVDWIVPALKEGKRLIILDFLTEFVNLGAVLVERRAIEGTEARFLPEGAPEGAPSGGEDTGSVREGFIFLQGASRRGWSRECPHFSPSLVCSSIMLWVTMSGRS